MRRTTTAIWIFAVLATVLTLPACGKKAAPATDQDLADARAVVEKAIHSETFEEYVFCMTARNRSHMKESPEARDFWTTQKENGRTVWRISSVQAASGGTIKVETRRDVSPPDSVLRIPAHPEETLRVYFLVRENGNWRMDELAFGP